MNFLYLTARCTLFDRVQYSTTPFPIHRRP